METMAETAEIGGFETELATVVDRATDLVCNVPGQWVSESPTSRFEAMADEILGWFSNEGPTVVSDNSDLVTRTVR